MTQFGFTDDRPSTISRQNQKNEQKDNKNPEQQKQEYQQYNSEGGDYYYNNYPAGARARAREATTKTRRFDAPKMDDLEELKTELPPREVMDKIADAYRANISLMITKAAAGIIERALSAGMEPATVILAIEETGLASRPSPYYLSAVLRNWAENGVVVSRARNIGVKVTDARPWWR